MNQKLRTYLSDAGLNWAAAELLAQNEILGNLILKRAKERSAVLINEEAAAVFKSLGLTMPQDKVKKPAATKSAKKPGRPRKVKPNARSLAAKKRWADIRAGKAEAPRRGKKKAVKKKAAKKKK